jgi:hypothetical protein
MSGKPDLKATLPWKLTKFVLAISVAFSASSSAFAYIRPIFLPVGGRAIFTIQGYEPGQPVDRDPSALYDQMKTPEQHQEGSVGKIVGTTVDNAFNLVCATEGGDHLNVICTINIGTSVRSKVSAAAQTAEFEAAGAEAKYFYDNLAGVGATNPFLFTTSNHWISIESTPNHFHFKFTEKP